MKQCSTCGHTGPAEEFRRGRSQCLGCVRARRKAYNEANREAIAARDKAYREVNREAKLAKKKVYYEANREDIAAKKKAHYEANREAVLAKVKEYHEANREAILAKKKAYYEANREAILARDKAHYEANREAKLAKQKVYTSRRRAAMNCAVPQRWVKSPEIEGCCYWCGADITNGYEVDHIMPISLGGPADESNEVKACRGCNGPGGKYTKHPLVWIAELVS